MNSPAATDADPAARIAAALERIEARLDRLEATVAASRSLAAQAAPVVATLTDTVDGLAARLAERGVDVDERLRTAAALLERLTAPEVARPLAALLEQGVVADLARLASQAPGAVAAVVDTFDSVAERAAAAGFDFDVRLRALLRAADRLTSNEAISALEHTLHSGILDGAAVETVGHLGRSIADASQGSGERITAWGLLRALGEPEIQRAVGFLISVARNFGGALARGELHAASAAAPRLTDGRPR